jgi:hypothetical protein
MSFPGLAVVRPARRTATRCVGRSVVSQRRLAVKLDCGALLWIGADCRQPPLGCPQITLSGG